MSENHLQQIFEPFHQVDATYTRERGGVGLGLAIVSRLLRLLRGEIRVSSAEGKGSVFTVALPLSRGLEKLEPVGLGPEVLVVDDNLDYLEALHNELSEAGYRVKVARSGVQALEMLSQQKPSMVLLDIVMPDMDGWEVLRRLRASPELMDVPVVIKGGVVAKDAR